ALLCFMLLQPLFGWIADVIGRRSNMLIYTVLLMIVTVPIFTAIGHATTSRGAFTLIMAAMLCISVYTPIRRPIKAELFPMHVRALGVGLSYAIANALFGGTAEYVALWFKSVGHESAFFWYVVAMAAIAFFAVLVMPDTRHRGYLTADEGKQLG